MSNYTIPRAPPRGLFSSFPPKSIDNTKSSNSNETQTLLNSNLKGKNGDGIDGGVDRGIGGGAPLPPMLRGDHPGELSLAKHVYAAPGAILSYLSFGFSSNLHFLVPMSVGYASMLLFRKHCGIATFLLGFGYLIGCHVFYMSGDVWKEGGIDATGSLMVLTLKVISCAINYNDGVLKEEVLREAQKKDRLIKMPSLIEYFGYCLSCGSHFAGPVYEMKDYLDWTESKGIWSPSEKGQSPSPVGAAIRALLQAAFCMGLYLYMVPLDKIYRAHIPRMGFLETIRIPVYVRIYSTVEILFHMVNFRGLHYSFWSPKPKWDRAKNVDVLGVELAKSSVQLPLVWNIQVTTWLRHYVYERLFMPGKKAGFFQLLATQTISAVWHVLV